MCAIEYILGNKQIYQKISTATYSAEKQDIIIFLHFLQITSLYASGMFSSGALSMYSVAILLFKKGFCSLI